MFQIKNFYTAACGGRVYKDTYLELFGRFFIKIRRKEI